MIIRNSKISIFLMLAMLFVYPFSSPNSISAAKEAETFNAVIDVDGAKEVPLFEEEDETSTILVYLKQEDEINILESSEDFSFVEYHQVSEDEEKTWQGYIYNEFIQTKADAEKNEQIDSEQSEVVQINEDEDARNDSDSDGDKHSSETVRKAAQDQKSFTGIALKSETNVYKDHSKDSKALKSYKAGTILLYRSWDKSWYEATVIIDGKRTIGYIHANDVENADATQENLRGIGLKAPTAVYANASAASKKLKTYSAGTVLRYQTFSKDWYEATVFIKGKKKTGYIHTDDVENADAAQKSVRGIGIKSPTAVYTNASTDSKKLKTYGAGTVLMYQTFSKNWYEATVYIKGKKKTGYIHAKDVEKTAAKQEDLRGIGLKAKTPIYAKAHTKSKKLKTYAKGSVLKYQTLSKNWYEAVVYVNGKKTTGYIHAKDVEDTVSKQKDLEGVTFKEKGTNVYQKASTGSKVLKKYSYGTILKYKSFTKDWYEAVVFIGGKKTNAYIKKSHVKALDYKLGGFAQKNPTHIYADPTKKSKTLKTYDRGSKLLYRAYDRDWYVVSVKVDGSWETGYLHNADVHFEMLDLIYKSKYNYDYKEMADRQAKKKPTSDGSGKKKASRGEIEFYSNPLNFPKSSDEYFQFLVLSTPAGLDAKKVNDRILKGKGSLEGTAQAFINAGEKYSINEAYLIAHALHETGNGKSSLSQGLPVDKNGKVTRDKKGNIAKTSATKHTVYNMFGYGAKDACPIECGAQYAFDHGWFTIEQSIYGGIESIHSYISRGQNTLYKMRWNPDGGLTPPAIPEWYQYATHTQWAVIQTRRIAEIYSLMDEYVVEMDVPVFNNTPEVGTTTPKSLEMRSGPNKNKKSIGTIPKNAEVKIVGSNVNAWYKVTYKKSTGWVEAKHVKLKYN